MKAPKAPDPYQTASAQQAAEVGASGASSIMNNPNIVTPYGSQSYSISGWEQVPDASGKMISVPRYTQTQSLSPDQMKLMGLNTQASYNLGQTAVQQSAKMRDYLGKSVDTKGWTGWNAGPTAPKNYQTQLGATTIPLQSKLAGAGQGIASGFGNAGKIATSFDAGGPITKTYGSGGNITKAIGNTDVRQDTGPTDRASIERAMMQNYTQDTAGQNAAQDAQMAARGLAPGSSQYGSMDMTRQNARGRAVNDAYLASGAESRSAQDAYNQASGQKFSQGAQVASFANQAQQQANDQLAQRAGFQNAAQMQQYQQNQGRAEFGNQAQGQNFQQLAARAAFGNAAQEQRFGQNAQNAQFGNQAQAQQMQQLLQRAGFSNEALAQIYQMQGASADRGNALRGMQAQESFALRNQPLNEISALMGGSQVTMPQFSPYQGQGINSANIAGLIGQNYQQQNAAAQNFNQGLFSLGGAGMGALGSWLGGSSDRRLKQDIVLLGGDLAGAPLYSFRYRHDPSVLFIGVMSDEVRELHPDAVREVDGYDTVNYDLLASRHEGEQT